MLHFPATSLRERLLKGETLVGSWINSGSPVVAELMAAAGFDFLCVDVEHSAVDLPQALQLFQAIHSGNPKCETMVRLHGIDCSFVKRYLDAGARGIIAPLVRSRDEAALIVEAAKYSPIGNRGVGFCRANQYGLNLKAEFDRANAANLVTVQIEHIDVVNHIDEILSVKGLDAVFIGPYDLSASMGITAQFDHPDFIAARDRILDSCKDHNIVPGIHVVPTEPEQVLARASEGYRLIAYSLDITMLTTVCVKGLAEIRNGLARIR